MGNYRSKFEQEVRLCWVPSEAGKLGLGVRVRRPPILLEGLGELREEETRAIH